MQPRRLRIALVVAATAATTALGACGGGDDEKADDKPATTLVVAETEVPEQTASTGESIVGETVPQTTTTVEAAPTTVPLGLPANLGIPPAGGLVLGPSASLSNSITVRGVPLEEVVAYVRAELAALGWTVNPDLTFAGPGALGQATVAQVGEAVEIQLVLSGPPQ